MSERNSRRSPQMRKYDPFLLSYQPGDGLEVEEVAHRGEDVSAVHVTQKTLFTKQHKMGDMDVGLVYTGTPDRPPGWTTVAVLRKTDLVDHTVIQGKLKGIFRRAGELHVLTVAVYPQSMSRGSSRARASVFGPPSFFVVRLQWGRLLERVCRNFTGSSPKRSSAEPWLLPADCTSSMKSRLSMRSRAMPTSFRSQAKNKSGRLWVGSVA